MARAGGNPLWRKGAPSPNPSGRPKGYNAFRKELRKRLIESGLIAESVEAIIRKSGSKDRAFLIKWATEYALGKPAERHEHTGAGGGPIEMVPQIDWKKLSDQELENLLSLLKKSLIADGPEASGQEGA